MNFQGNKRTELRNPDLAIQSALKYRLCSGNSKAADRKGKAHSYRVELPRFSALLCRGQSQGKAVAHHGSPRAAADWQASGTATALILGTLLQELKCSPLAKCRANAKSTLDC